MLTYSQVTRPRLLQPIGLGCLGYIVALTAGLGYFFTIRFLFFNALSLFLLLIETLSYFLTAAVLCKTYYDGRPGHTPYTKRVQTSDSHPYSIDFLWPALVSQKSTEKEAISVDVSIQRSEEVKLSELIENKANPEALLGIFQNTQYVVSRAKTLGFGRLGAGVLPGRRILQVQYLHNPRL